MHFVPILNLSVREGELLGLDLPYNGVVLLKADNPLTEALRCEASLSDSSRLKLRIIEERRLDFCHDLRVDVVLIIVLEL